MERERRKRRTSWEKRDRDTERDVSSSRGNDYRWLTYAGNPVLCLRNYWNTLCVRNKWRNMPWKVLVQDHPVIQEMPLRYRDHVSRFHHRDDDDDDGDVGHPRLSYRYVYVIATLRILRLVSIEESRIYLLFLPYSSHSSCFLLVPLASPSCIKAIRSFMRLLSSFHANSRKVWDVRGSRSGSRRRPIKITFYAIMHAVMRLEIKLCATRMLRNLWHSLSIVRTTGLDLKRWV